MNVKPIRTESDYRETLAIIEGLMSAAPGSPEGDRLEVLTTLVEDYESRHYPLDFPDAIEAIKFEMEQKNLTARNLEPMIGKSNRVYEVLNRKRALTVKMIWKLNQQLGIPAESLIKPHQRTAAEM